MRLKFPVYDVGFIHISNKIPELSSILGAAEIASEPALLNERLFPVIPAAFSHVIFTSFTATPPE